MCGIVAVRGAAHASSLEATITEALALMRQRGPDDAGAVLDAGRGCGVGMARLRVRSAAAEPVPFRDPEGCAHAFNGELYAVSRDGVRHVVRGGVDEARAVLDTTACPDGMWALACLDPDGSMRVSRDPWGIKPLWLRSWPVEAGHGERWVVASSLPAVVAPRPQPRLRRRAVAQVLLTGQVVDGGSMWEGIRALPPGARGVDDLEGASPEEWFAPVWRQARESVEQTGSDDEVGARIRASLASSVASTLDADRVTGLALSGGLDSTIIAHHARDLGRADLRTVSVRVDGDDDGLSSLTDLRWEGSAPRGWQHHVRPVGPCDYLDLMRRSVRELGQPTAMTSVPLYLALADAAAEAGVVVLLVGEGADEVWGGYRSYLEVTDATTPTDFYLGPRRLDLVRELMGDEPAGEARTELLRLLPQGTGGEAIRRVERRLSLGPLLHRTDALMMARSIEARTPFLHGESWALAEQLPWRRLVTQSQTKVALRAAYSEELPSFRDEHKAAFRAPWDRWLATDLAEDVTDLVSSALPALQTLGIDPTAASAVVSRGVAGDPAAAACTFTLCTLAIWSETLDEA